MSLTKFLKNGTGGGNLLFCGAGFSANCLNFTDEEVGVASPLHQLLNDSMNYQYKEMQVAADEYVAEYGEHKLLSLLTDKYSISRRTKDIDEILRYPWTRIYTTNYDDVISQSLTHLGIAHYDANNTEKPYDVNKSNANKTWIVHLHGALRRWEIKNFTDSCVLGRESYLRVSANSNWAETLRQDYARANAVFFVGFSNSDFYLAEHLFSAEASKDKVFFINSERSAEDKELVAKQKRFGECLAIGKEAFATTVRDALCEGGNPALELHSFIECELNEASEERASVSQQEAFMISGRHNEDLHFRDVLDRSHSYRAERPISDEIVEFLKKDNSTALIHGGICSGKTILFEECIIKLQTEGEIVFKLNSKFYDLLSEAKSIVEAHPTSILAIDNCFSLRSELREIVKLANEAGTRILLASRTLAYDTEQDLREILIKDAPFQTFDTEILSESEGLTIIECTDRIGGWGETVSNLSKKRKILERDHSSRLSGFLLGIFKSPHIRRRFLSELDMLRANGKSVETALILALYIKNIGEDVHEHVLSEMLGLDSVELFKGASNIHEFIAYKPETRRFELLPSVSTREALRQFFDSKTVTDVIVEAVKSLENVRFDASFKRVFTELMRYTQLKQVVTDFDQQDRFFDRLSELWFCNNHVLFWLQWSMAMRDHGEWGRAEQYLSEAYGRGKNFANFDSTHLDDQKAGLLLDSVRTNAGSAEYLRRFNEACNLLGNSMRSGAITSHNYLTVNKSFDVFFSKAMTELIPIHVGIMKKVALNLEKQVQQKLKSQPEGFIKTSMEDAAASIQRAIKLLSKDK